MAKLTRAVRLISFNENFAESIKSINKTIASNPDLAGHMNRLPGGRGLQKHIDVTRIDLERQQKVK